MEMKIQRPSQPQAGRRGSLSRISVPNTMFSSRAMYEQFQQDEDAIMDITRKTEMKLTHVVELENTETSKDYTGRIRIWPGVFLIVLIFAGATAAIILGANDAAQQSKIRLEQWAIRDKRQRGIKDNKTGDGVDLVDGDGQIGNPREYTTQSKLIFDLKHTTRATTYI